MHSYVIPISNPEIWWRGHAQDLTPWVPADPDAPWPPRHRDRDAQRWAVIAEAVALVSDALAHGEVRQYVARVALEQYLSKPDYSYHYHLSAYAEATTVLVDLELATQLTETEYKIVRSWFLLNVEVVFDPWSTTILNGRHRLWATLPHFAPSALVPVASYSALGTSWSRPNNLTNLAQVRWFTHADPLNTRFIETLNSTR